MSLGPQTLREVPSQPRRVIRLERCNSDSHRRRTLQAIALTTTYCPTCGRQTRYDADLLRQMPQIQSTERTTVHRMPKRASYERNTIAAILDEGFFCHVGFVVDSQPYVIPTIHARVGNQLYLHGSAASRMLRAVGESIPVCVTVTLLDGLVLARSAFHHSLNYRSVVILGTVVEVTDQTEKHEALKAVVEHVVPQRWEDVRWPTEQELKATTVLKLPIEEASAKIRTGPSLDDEEDYQLGCWAGEIPLRLIPQTPVPDPRLDPTIVPPAYVRGYHRPPAREHGE